MRQASYGQRHATLINPEAYDFRIAIVGAGAIGSHTAISLARMGYQHLEIIDFDEVSEENMGSQGYTIDDIGKPKVNALAEHIRKASGIEAKTHIRKVDKEDYLMADILIMAVDSMSARMDVLKAFANPRGWYIDPRMGAEYAKLLVLNKMIDDDSFYKANWYPDSEAVAESCTAKATVYCANILSGFVVKAVKDITTGADKYMRQLDYDIKANSGIAWNNRGERLF